jgi:hypothetical protein
MRLRVGQLRRPSHEPGGLTARCKAGVLLSALVIVALLTFGSLGHLDAAPASVGHHISLASFRGADVGEASSTDVFMVAIVAQNGQLAWQQLCPSLQEVLPAATLAHLVAAQGAAYANQNAQLGVDYIGAHAWANGGEIHIYVVTAHWSSGTEGHALFVLRTQVSGCIDGILNG